METIRKDFNRFSNSLNNLILYMFSEISMLTYDILYEGSAELKNLDNYTLESHKYIKEFAEFESSGLG